MALGAGLIRPATADTDGRRGKVSGVTFSYAASLDQQVRNLDLGRIKAAGADTVSIPVWWKVYEQVPDQLLPDVNTPTDAELESSIGAARAQGLRVALNPLLRCSGCAGGWRGNLHPSNQDTFFNSYRTMLNRYADLAQRTGVSLLLVGSEMNSIDTDPVPWRETIRQVRARYSGTIAYGANWDHVGAVPFWDAVDVVGVSAYFPLTDVASPSVAQLQAAWHEPTAAAARGHRWFSELAEVAGRTHRPVLFTEAGYRSIAHAARMPGDGAVQDAADEGAQAAAYQALLATFENQSWWAGTLWWGWDSTAATDTASFNPRGKAAEGLLTRWWAQGWRPSTVAPPAGAHVTTQGGGRSVVPVRAGAARPASSAAAAHATGNADVPAIAGTPTVELRTGTVGAPTGSRRGPLSGTQSSPDSRSALGAIAFLALVGASVGVTRHVGEGTSRRLRPVIA
jgi:hypothetical protein